MREVIKKVATVVDGILLVMGVAGCGHALAHSTKYNVSVTANLVVLVFLAYYLFVGFKKPHGNLLKYTIGLYAFSLVIIVPNLYPKAAFMMALVIALVGYVAGRLNRIEQNRYLMCLILVLIAYIFIDGLQFIKADLNCVNGFAYFAPLIYWFLIVGVYFCRFKDHKFAGLIDKKDANELSEKELETVSNVWMHL